MPLFGQYLKTTQQMAFTGKGFFLAAKLLQTIINVCEHLDHKTVVIRVILFIKHS